MGIYSGSVAFQRYLIHGGPRKYSISKLSELLDPFKADPVKLDQSPKAERLGWVRPLTPQDAETISDGDFWDVSDCVVSSGVLLRMRHERRKVPSTLLQMIYKQKLAEHQLDTGKPMNRTERQKLKQDLANELLKRTLPHITFIDALWKTEDKELYIFNSSKTMCERLLQLFGETFAQELELDVIKFSPASAWVEADDIDQRFDRLTKVEPSVFARQLS